MTTPQLIALTGAEGTGKSEIAQILSSRHHFHRINFADPFKRMLKSIGLNESELNGDMREEPCELLCGRTPRYAEKTLGTDWGRNLISKDLWVTAWKGLVREELSHGYSVICDGCKYLNEAAAVRALSGQIWRVNRPGVEIKMDHESSMEIARIAFDLRFTNDGTLSDLRFLVDKAIGPQAPAFDEHATRVLR